MPPEGEALAPNLPAGQRESVLGLARPGGLMKYLELRVLLETLSLLPSAPALGLRKRGDGRPVMVIPGFLTDDGSTWPLRKYLRFIGYDAQPWRMGRNNGNPERDAEALAEIIDAQPADAPAVTLIGWSLGGVIAREVARRVPHRVREVITMGTPVEGGPKYTIVGPVFARRRNIDLDEFEVHVHEINQQGLTVPVTVIYSKGDGIVGWRAMIDRYNAQTRHKRVIGSHIGLGTNPWVWHTIERTLKRSA